MRGVRVARRVRLDWVRHHRRKETSHLPNHEQSECAERSGLREGCGGNPEHRQSKRHPEIFDRAQKPNLDICDVLHLPNRVQWHPNPLLFRGLLKANGLLRYLLQLLLALQVSHLWRPQKRLPQGQLSLPVETFTRLGNSLRLFQ